MSGESLSDRIIESGPYGPGQAGGDRSPLHGVIRLDDVEELRNELLEGRTLRKLVALQHERMAKATELWRAQDPEARALTMPDLGDLLDWLIGRIESLTAAEYPYPCSFCGNRFRTVFAANECEDDHRAYAGRKKST